MITVTPVIAQLHGYCFSVYMFEDRDSLSLSFSLPLRRLIGPFPIEPRRVNRICFLSACFNASILLSITDIATFFWILFIRVYYPCKGNG